ncbi:MAG: nucleotide exchange factor GrpE, partial [Flavobacterium sp.]
MNTDNTDKEPMESANENAANEIETAEALSVEAQLQEDLAKEKDKFLRLFAEFENYKKRTAKERIDLFRTANQEVLQA